MKKEKKKKHRKREKWRQTSETEEHCPDALTTQSVGNTHESLSGQKKRHLLPVDGRVQNGHCLGQCSPVWMLHMNEPIHKVFQCNIWIVFHAWHIKLLHCFPFNHSPTVIMDIVHRYKYKLTNTWQAGKNKFLQEVFPFSNTQFKHFLPSCHSVFWIFTLSPSVLFYSEHTSVDVSCFCYFCWRMQRALPCLACCRLVWIHQLVDSHICLSSVGEKGGFIGKVKFV